MSKLRCVRVDGSNNDSADHHQPIRNGDIDLTVESVAGVDHLDVRKVGHDHDLTQQLEHTRDNSLGCDNCREDGYDE